MKAEILKIAGVKNEKEFYKKYPSEEAFMKVHGKEFKKAKLGKAIAPKAQDGIGSYTGGENVYNPQPLNFQNAYDSYDLQMTGSTNAQRQAQAQAAQQAQQAAKKPAAGGGGGGMDVSKIMGMIGSGEGGMDASALAGMAKKGKKVPKGQTGLGLNSPAGGTMTGMQAAQTNPYMYGTLPPLDASGQTPMLNPNQNPPMLDPMYAGTLQQQIAGSGNLPKKDPMDAISKYTGLAGKVYGGIKKLKAEKEARKSAEQQASVSDLSLQAALSQPEQKRRMYDRPDDPYKVIQPGQLNDPQGRNTNILKAQDGMQIGGNQTEIQNMYNPGDIYQDLGFEPLSDSEIVKQYRAGGLIHRMQTGGGMTALDFGNAGSGIPAPSWATVGNAGQMIGQGVTGNNAGGEVGADIGGTAGGAIGMAVGGPAGKAIGQAIGQTVGAIGGGLLDRNPMKMEKAQNRTKRNVQTAAMYSMGQGLQSQYSAHVRNGGDIPYAEDGWVSNDWLPQVITQFGEHKVSDLLKPDPMMDTLRTGGRVTQNNMYPQDQYAFGGSLKTTWGGYAEPISNNPHDDSETVMFRGLPGMGAHSESDGNGHTGIGVDYGNDIHDSYTDYAEFGSKNAPAKVEVEKREPAIEMKDPQTGEKNMLVFGDLIMPKQFLSKIDLKAETSKAVRESMQNKKFKNYIADVAHQENKLNKLIEKSTKKLNNLKSFTPTDLLEMNSFKANLYGANKDLERYSQIKRNAAGVQTALHDTANEHGVDVVALAKGKIKIDKQAQKEMAKYGKEIFKAQDGTNLPALKQEDYEYLKKLYDEAKTQKKGDKVLKFQQEFHRLAPEFAKKVIGREPLTTKGKKEKLTTADLASNEDEIFGQRTEQYMSQLDKAPRFKGKVTAPTAVDYPETTSPTTTLAVQPLKQDPWMTALNQLAPYLRPSDTDYNVDLYPEMMAAGMNQVEPVFAQGYQPQLLTPYDISYQDQLNEITAQARAAERMAGQNPAAAASILATASGEKNKVLGEQFRQNQAQRMGVYNQNIATLNDAQLKNLGIYADQAAKQSQARSNTKAQAMEIEKSMSDKIAKNKSENNALQIYENLYNYRFGKSGRAQNYNPLAQFDISADGKVSAQAAPEGYEYETILKKKKKEETARNGSIVRALKNF